MRNYDIGRRQIGVVFLALLFSFSILNAVLQWNGMKGGFVWILENTEDLSKLQASFANFENFISQNIIGREKFVEFYAYMQKLMGKQEMDNFYLIRDQRGQMVYGAFDPEDMVGIGVQESARRLRRMQLAVERFGTKVFFVNPPALHIRDKRQYPLGLPPQDVNHRQDSFLYWLSRYGVDSLDLRESLGEHDLPADRYFFNTDHHWRISTAFTAFGDIITWLNRQYGANLDPEGYVRDIRNYNVKVYENASLGSMGRRTGVVYSGLDDFEVIWPKFDLMTNFTYIGRFTEPERMTVKTGPFSQSLIYLDVLQTEKPYQTDFYSVYHSGIKSHEMIINHNNPEAPRLLMIRDSFSLPLGVFMAPLFSEIHMMWPVSGEIRLDVEKYLQENVFDYIMVELSETGLYVNNFYFFSESMPYEEEWESSQGILPPPKVNP
ncbi:MAG: hypothetical protein LBS48_06465 [Treponema sp.]|nr:hypothetical protein [Treponema sp.]